MTSEPVVLIAPRVALLLPDGVDGALAVRLRHAVSDGEPLPAIALALMTTGVGELPSLAVVALDDGGRLRVFVRGSGRVSVLGRDQRTVEVRARVGVTTWHEDVFDDAVSAAIGSVSDSSIRIEFLASPEGSPVAPPSGRSSAALLSHVESGSSTESQVESNSVLSQPRASTPAPEAPSGDQTLVPPAGRPADDISATPSMAGQEDEDDGDVDDHTLHRGAAPATRGHPRPPGPQRVPAPPPTPGASPPTAPSGLISSVPTGAYGPPIAPMTERQADPAAPPVPVDDYTIAAADHRRMVHDLGPPVVDPPASSVQAVLCVGGHPNPPNAPQCRTCDGEIPDRTVRDVPRPTLGRLRLSSGQVIELDRSQLLGRRPVVSEETSRSELPGLVAIPDPEQSLSRVHAEVRLQGWDVYVMDCGSRNGTLVEIPGHEPVNLRAGEPCLIVPGTRVSLSDVVDFRFEIGAR